MSITPLGGSGSGKHYSCGVAACNHEMKDDCPDELRVWGQGWNDGKVLACKSACLAFNTDQYCCRGAHNQPNTCQSHHWPKNYPKHFKDRCPDAYSYAYDDRKSTFTCIAPAYLITVG